MTFTLALTIITALIAIGLAVVCHSLLIRLDVIEKALVGGLEVPSGRLRRERFEHNLVLAHNRVLLAEKVEHGLVLFVGAEFLNNKNPLRLTIEHTEDLPIQLVAVDTDIELREKIKTELSASMPAGTAISLGQEQGLVPELLGVTVTPFAFLIDQSRVLAAKPAVSPEELTELVAAF